jgi:hypothetical protein
MSRLIQKLREPSFVLDVVQTIIALVVGIVLALDMIGLWSAPGWLSENLLSGIFIAVCLLMVSSFLERRLQIDRFSEITNQKLDSLINSFRHKSQLSVNISSDNNANVDYLCDYIAKNKISEARLIQYSGDMVRRVVEKLLEKGARVELLLQHPSKAPNQYQIEKMASFHHRVKHDFRNNQNLVIRYYKEPASLKGIKLDNSFLSMGWYTYRNKSRSEIAPWLYGHNNATITVQIGNSDVHDLVATFDETFQSLWEIAEPHSEKIDATVNQMLRQRTKGQKQ